MAKNKGNTAVAAVPKTEDFAIIPKEKEAHIREFDTALTMFRDRLADPELSDITRAMIQADAIRDIENRITQKMLDDIKPLMNSPLGFKTDRPPGAKNSKGELLPMYTDVTIKRCMIVALLMGAKLTGNQWNIIAGNCYLTKEFLRPAILTFPGVSDLETEIGTPSKHGEKTAAMEASAKWKVRGKQQELVCIKGDPAKGVIDSRIIVNCFATSSPDEIRGKAERKLYARIYQRLTGMNLEAEDESGNIPVDKPVTIDHVPPKVGVEPEDVTEANDKALADSAAANNVYLTWVADLDGMTEIAKFNSLFMDRKALVWESDWTEKLKNFTIDAMAKAMEQRGDAIRAGRGQRSNPQTQQQSFVDESEAADPEQAID